MESYKPLARAGYVLAAAMVVFPILDSALPLLPLRLGDERWRWSAVGQMSNVLLVPMLGLLLAIVLAALSDGRRVRRVAGAICGILAVIVAVMSVFFLLDYFQVRTIAKPTMVHAMGVATTLAFIKNLLSIIALGLLARAGFSGPKATTFSKAERPVTVPGSPLVGVGSSRTAPAD